ncbi:MAG: hypothetical protein ACOC1X_01585 [Promethearchaeota archaeon]
METDNLDNISEKKEHLYKRIYFAKNEESNLVLEENQEKPREAYVKLEKPLQIMMNYDGLVGIRGHKNVMEVVGVIQTFLNNNMISKLVNKLDKIPDYKIRDGKEINIDAYSFYLAGFDNKEEVMGMIQNNYKDWSQNLEKIYNNYKEDSIDAGNKALENDGNDRIRVKEDA